MSEGERFLRTAFVGTIIFILLVGGVVIYAVVTHEGPIGYPVRIVSDESEASPNVPDTITTDDGTVMRLDPETGTYSSVAEVTVTTEDGTQLKLNTETGTYSVVE